MTTVMNASEKLMYDNAVAAFPARMAEHEEVVASLFAYQEVPDPPVEPTPPTPYTVRQVTEPNETVNTANGTILVTEGNWVVTDPDGNSFGVANEDYSNYWVEA